MCTHAGRGRPRSSLAAVPNLIPSEGLARCGMRARRRRVSSSAKKLVGLGNKKSETCKDEGGPTTDLSRLGPAGRGGRGRTRPPYPARDLGCGRAGSGAGRGHCGPRRPTALTVNSNPQAARFWLQKRSLITPCSDCLALPFRSPGAQLDEPEGLCQFSNSVWKGLDSSLEEKTQQQSGGGLVGVGIGVGEWGWGGGG